MRPSPFVQLNRLFLLVTAFFAVRLFLLVFSSLLFFLLFLLLTVITSVAMSTANLTANSISSFSISIFSPPFYIFIITLLGYFVKSFLHIIFP